MERAPSEPVAELGTGGSPASLLYFDMEAREVKTYMTGVMGYELSADGAKVLTMGAAGVAVTPAAAAPDAAQQAEGTLDTASLRVAVKPQEVRTAEC